MPVQIHSYVDEAGDPTIFGRKRGSGVIVGNDGCSKFFIMGKLEVLDQSSLETELEKLHNILMADPYFAGVESFKPERKKTALGFHAKDDLPEVRYQVFQLLREQAHNLRFHAVIADKQIIAQREIKKRKSNEKSRFDPNSLYDGLIRELYSKFHGMADEHHICIAKRGKSDRTEALHQAIEHAENDFEKKFGFRRGSWQIQVSTPEKTASLQAVDYFLWALQRFYERGESRFLDMMWPQIGEVHDLHHGGSLGIFFKGDEQPTLETVFPRKHEKQTKKKPRI